METEVHCLTSEHVGDEFTISVGRCSLPDEQPTEILLLTDAGPAFGMALGAAEPLMLFKGLPALWVVGVNYRVPNMREALDGRMRDLTPTAVGDSPGSGGAPGLLGFVRDELSPWLADRYGADPTQAAYFGHSFGGLFGAWVLLNEPSTFRRYGLSSPSLWWDEGVMLRQEADYALAHDDLPARVLITVGELEQPSAELARVRRLPEAERATARAQAASDAVDMVTGAGLFADALSSRAYPNLASEFQIYPRENHATAWSLSLSRSLRYLWDLPD